MTTLAQLEGFHIHAAYRMGEKRKPRKGLHHMWVYPQSNNMLKECRMQSISHYLGVRRETTFQDIVDQPVYIACRGG
jgi:hypothetical protein